jgi:hypothetical protein
MKKLYVLLCLFLFSSQVYAVDLTQNQERILQLAYHHGSQIHYKNQSYGETIAAIVYQETKAGAKRYQRNGIIVGDKSRKGHYKSLGVMQIQIPAARDVFRWYPEIMFSYFGRPYYPTDEEIIVALLTDVYFNIEVGTAYFHKMLEMKKSWSGAILAYNRGVANDGTDPNNYVHLVKKWRLEIVLPLIKK